MKRSFLSKEVNLKRSRLLQSIDLVSPRDSKLLSSKQTETWARPNKQIDVWARPNMSVVSSDGAENIHN